MTDDQLAQLVGWLKLSVVVQLAMGAALLTVAVILVVTTAWGRR